MTKRIITLDQADSATKLFRESITEYFKELRGAQNMTQADLADILDLKPATVRSTESGRTRWNDENLFRFAAALGADPGGLLRQAASKLDGELPTVDEVDPMLAQFVDLYRRRDLPGMLHLMGVLSIRWGRSPA